MPPDITQAERDATRIKVLSRQLRDAQQRNYDYREEVDGLQDRISRLIAQLHQPQSLDEVIHSAKGGE